jgi:hypothetical protein
LDDSALYCSKCGKAMGTTPLMPRQARISGHIRLLGILWIALSSFRFIPGVVLFLISRWMPLGDPDIPFFVPPLLLFLSVVFLAFGVLGIFAGWGLLTRQSWARAFRSGFWRDKLDGVAIWHGVGHLHAVGIAADGIAKGISQHGRRR